MTPSGDSGGRPIKWWYGVVFFFGAIVFQMAFSAAIYMFSATGLMGATREQVEANLFSPVSMAIQVLITGTFLALISIGPIRISGRSVRENLRLKLPPSIAIVVAAVAVIPLGFIVDEMTYTLTLISPEVFDSSSLDGMVGIFGDASSPEFVLVTLAVTVCPALGEELLFRGMMLRAFGNAVPGWLAVIVTAFLFGVIHMDALQGAGAMLIGLYLGFVVLATGSIWPAIVGHAVNNLTCSVFARVDPAGAGTAFDQGHPWPVLVVSFVGVSGAVVFLARNGRRAR